MCVSLRDHPAHNACYVIIGVELANGGSAEARVGGVLYYWKAADSLFLCGVLFGDCVWWLTTLCGCLFWKRKKGKKEKCASGPSWWFDVSRIFFVSNPSLRGAVGGSQGDW